MYNILDNAEMMTFEAIRAKYDGKWVFLTNCEFSEGNMLIRGTPRVIADKTFEGVDERIYDVYDDAQLFGETTDCQFIEYDYLIKSITFVQKGGDAG